MDIEFEASGELQVVMDVVDPIKPKVLSSTTKANNSVHKGRRRPPKYPALARAAVGQLQAISLPARTTTKVVKIIGEAPTKGMDSCCVETAEICLIELALNLFEVRCKQLANSQDRFMLIDGSGTTKLQRSFFAVHFGGFINQTKWSSLFGLFELVDKGAHVDVKAV